MKLNNKNQMEYEGVIYNWFVGDGIQRPDDSQPTEYWCYAVLPPNWNTRKAIYCGRFNYDTREVTNVSKCKD